MKNILIPTDFSANAQNALYYGIELAKMEKARIHLLHALDTPDKSRAVKACEQKMKSLGEIIEHACNLNYEIICEEGTAEDVIIDVTKSRKIDLIVMGTKGESSLEKVIFGSNTANVIERASCPVLAVPDGTSFKLIRKITFATQYHKSDLDELKKVVEIAKPFRAQVNILHISPEEESPAIEVKEMEKFKDTVTQKIDYNEFTFQLLPGNNPELELKEYLESGATDLLVMSAHHRNLWDKLFGSSLSNRMVYNNSIPLLVFHYQKDSAVKLIEI